MVVSYSMTVVTALQKNTLKDTIRLLILESSTSQTYYLVSGKSNKTKVVLVGMNELEWNETNFKLHYG